MGHLEILCRRLQKIQNDKERNDVQNQYERAIWGDYISFIKPEERERERVRTTNYIKKLEMPLNYNKIAYNHFRNLTKAVYTYQTTYPERHERKEMI